jgi:hypothetical protein
MMQSGRDFVACVVIALVIAWSIFLMVQSSDFGYKNAYRDMHKGIIEEHVKRDFPELWIEFNAPLKEEKK